MSAAGAATVAHEAALGSSDYLGVLLSAFVDEVQADGRLTSETRPAMLRAAAHARSLVDDASFDTCLAAYERLCREKATTLNMLAEVACSYESMEDFWVDAARQEAGTTDRTYWDSYEHGRRRQLERLLSTTYGSESAVLLNTGMSALDVAIGAAALVPEDVVLVHQRAYFETTDYLDAVLRPRGVRIVRADLSDPSTSAWALSALDPRVVLFETSLNCPPCDVPAWSQWTDGGRLLIVDNSTLSHGIRWFDLMPAKRVLVVESAIKYLTSNCTAGVVYGSGDDIAAARVYARRVGQQLQERAFNHLQFGELSSAARRVALHGCRLTAFVDEIDQEMWAWSATARSATRDRSDPLQRAIEQCGPGALLFLQADAPADALPEIHRGVLRRWRQHSAASGRAVEIRAGFGWARTSARAYESTALNQADAPCYLRVSIGIEPEARTRELARALTRAAAETWA